jgi:hypothetical protein
MTLKKYRPREAQDSFPKNAAPTGHRVSLLILCDLCAYSA